MRAAQDIVFAACTLGPFAAMAGLYCLVRWAERPRRRKPFVGPEWEFTTAPLIERPEWSERP